MKIPSEGWLNPSARAERLELKGGWCVRAARPIATGRLVSVWGGEVISFEALRRYPTLRPLAVQIGEDRYLLSFEEGPEDLINHSCEPNLGLVSDIALVALRDIQAGEELTYDYAMTDGSSYDEFRCTCGSPSCRCLVQGTDWMRTDLRLRYRGHFSTYLEWRWRNRERRGVR